MGSIGLVATAFYTFLPSFLFIFVGGAVLERSRGNAVVKDVLGFVTAAVVGVILNLTLFLGKEVLFPDGFVLDKLDLVALAWMLVSVALLFRFRLNVVYLILMSMQSAIDLPSDQFKSSDEYSTASYLKTALWLYILENAVGREKLDAAFQHYFKLWTGKHPQPADLKAAFEESLGTNLDRYFQLLNKEGKFE